MGLERKTFALEELNDNFWGKVILVNIQNSTGMGGWGCLSDSKDFRMTNVS